MSRFRCGLVVGKFSPLHRGHELVIQRAFEACAQVVVISYSKPEFPGCEAATRERWLRQRFPSARVLVVTESDLARWPAVASTFRELPANDAPGETHQAFCAALCSTVLGVRIDAVFGSETYVPAFAAHLTLHQQRHGGGGTPVCPVLVDPARVTVPISGSQLRSAPAAWRDWVGPEVNASAVLRIALVGGESTGKTTLAQRMAERLATTWVPEYGRERWEERQGHLEYGDLLEIAREQVRREDAAARGASVFLFCDTTPLTTLFYSLELFGQAEPELWELSRRSYARVVLCEADFEFQQDGTRRDAAFRAAQQAWYRRELGARGLAYLPISGTLDHRLAVLAEHLVMA